MHRLFLKEEFEANGELYISTEDGSVQEQREMLWMRSVRMDWKQI